MESLTKNCVVCGKEFQDRSKSHTKMTCSDKCRTANCYKNPDKKFERNLYIRLKGFKRLGCKFDETTIQQIRQALKNGKCELCGQDFELDNLHIDHDHITGEYRGVICGQHNHTLGLIGDNPIAALSIAEYLIEHNAGGVDWKNDLLSVVAINVLARSIILKLQLDTESVDRILEGENSGLIKTFEEMCQQ